MEIIQLSESTGAKCLDGKPSGYFVFKPTIKQKTQKFIISFVSGGWCNHQSYNGDFLESCYERSQNYLGNFALQSQKMQSVNYGGMFSQNKQINPFFQDWLSIIIAGCDGNLNQGYSNIPYLYKNQEIWFRGENNTKAALNDAWERYDLKSASEVLIVGCSSAGLSALLWSNYIKNLFPSTTKLWTYVDGGFYVDYIFEPTGLYRQRQQMMDILKYANVEVDPINQDCVEDNPDEKWKCLLAEYAVQYVKNPVFVSQFEYDWWHIRYILGQNCENLSNSNQKCQLCDNKINDKLEKWKLYVIEKIESSLKNNIKSYYWRLPCFHHCTHIDDLIFNNKEDFNINSQSITEILYNWMYS